MNRGQLKNLMKTLINDVTDDEIFTDERLNTLLYDAALEVQNIVERSDEAYFQNISTFNVTKDQTEIMLNDRTRTINRVRRIDCDPPKEFKYVDYREFYNTYRYHTRFTGNQYIFTVRNLTIEYPHGLGTDHTLEVLATTQLNDLTDDGQTWTRIPVMARRLIAYKAALTGLVAEDSDARQLSSLVNKHENDLVSNLEHRVDAQPRGVIYVDDEEY